MGCDIHIYPEIYDGSNWIPAEPFTLPYYWHETILDDMGYEYGSDERNIEKAKFKAMSEADAIKEYGDDDRVIWDHPFNRLHGGRNYNFFALVADVRNHGRSIPPMTMPKGLPNDLSEKVAKLAEDLCNDGHSHSWHTLKAFLDCDWTKEIDQEGYITQRQFPQFYKDKQPMSWSIIETESELISNEEMRLLCLGIYGDLDPDENYETKVTWTRSRRAMAGEKYYDDFIAKLQSYGEPENVRVVFWFDN